MIRGIDLIIGIVNLIIDKIGLTVGTIYLAVILVIVEHLVSLGYRARV